MKRLGFLLICCCLYGAPLLSEAGDQLLPESDTPSSAKSTHLIADIEIIINPIFDLSQDDDWLYRTANSLHIETKQKVIKRLLPFKEGDSISLKQLREAERILRSHGFLREASITQELNDQGNAVLMVQTWDNWTLFPTVDINREGGETEYSYGIVDDNLLGLGIAADIAYFSEQDRDGYILSLNSDAISSKHLSAGLVLADNSDGEQQAFSLAKPFYTLDDTWALGGSIDSHRQEIRVDANELEVNRFKSDRQFAQFFTGWSNGLAKSGEKGAIWRYFAGISHDKLEFSPLANTTYLAESRDLTYPWLAVEYQQDNFVTTRNLFLLAKTEDVQLGWRHFLSLGYNLESSYRADGLIWRLNTGYFGRYNEQHWFRYGLKGHGVYASQEASTSYYEVFYEHFYRANSSRTWYLKSTFSGADNPYLDQPISLGGEAGLRGFPNDYQHGNRKILVNVEKRFYPEINLLQLMDIGFVAFLDGGKAYGESVYPNQETGWLASAGLGLRFFLTRSSGNNVLNLNFSQPLNSDFVKDFDVSIVVRTSF